MEKIMDTTNKYINMCSCFEIQNINPDFNIEDQNFIANFHHAKACPIHGSKHLWTKDLAIDFFCVVCGKPLVRVDDIPEINSYIENGNYKSIWLPRQDQLQEIAFDKREDSCHDPECLLHDFGKYVVHYAPPEISNTFEKLWLGFIMLEFYRKKWENQKWVKIKSKN